MVRRAPSAAAMRRRESQKRRRDVLMFLLAGALTTLALGAIPGLHRLLYVQVVFDLAVAAYVALLLHVRNLAAERDAKLSFLPPVRAVPVGMVRRGTGRYASLTPAFDTAELALRRAAN